MRWLTLALLAAFAVPPAAAAKLNKCVDEKGVTHYYDKTPPDACKDREITEMTGKGVVTKKVAAPPTEEELKARETEAARKKEEEARARDRERRDQALLATYASEKEIDLARDRNLQSTEAVIKSIEPRLKSAQARQEQNQKQAESHTQQKKPVPDWLKEELERGDKEVKKLSDEMAGKQKEMDQIRAKFDADKKRYRELTQAMNEKKK